MTDEQIIGTYRVEVRAKHAPDGSVTLRIALVDGEPAQAAVKLESAASPQTVRDAPNLSPMMELLLRSVRDRGELGANLREIHACCNNNASASDIRPALRRLVELGHLRTDATPWRKGARWFASGVAARAPVSATVRAPKMQPLEAQLRNKILSALDAAGSDGATFTMLRELTEGQTETVRRVLESLRASGEASCDRPARQRGGLWFAGATVPPRLAKNDHRRTSATLAKETIQ